MVAPTKLPIIGALVRRAAGAIEWRIDERVGPINERLENLERRADGVDRRLGDDLAFLVDEVRCIGPQVAALEKRMEDIRIRMGSAESPVDPQTGDVRTGELESIRAEHARTRVRLTAISQFEERLRRLENDAG